MDEEHDYRVGEGVSLVVLQVLIRVQGTAYPVESKHTTRLQQTEDQRTDAAQQNTADATGTRSDARRLWHLALG